MRPDPASLRRHLGATLALGLPLIGSHLAQFAINLTDTLMLGWYDVQALAAQVLGGTLFFVLFIMGSGLAFAVMPMVSEAGARGDSAAIRRTTRMGMWASAGFGVAVLVPLLWAERLFGWLGQPAAMAEGAGIYLRIAGWGMLPALLVMVLKSHLSALERARAVLIVTLGAVVLNAAINYLLIFGRFGAPELGLRGAAIASLAVHAGSMLALALHAARALPEQALFARLWRPDRGALAEVIRHGWPIGLTNLAEVGLFSASTVMMGWVGTLALAAHGIALQIASVVFMIHLGLSNVATIRAGQAAGRGDGAALRDGALMVSVVSALAALATVVVFLSAPRTLIGLFLDPADPVAGQVLALGAAFLAAAALFQLFDAAQVIALGLLRGLMDTRVPMVFAAFSYWVVGVPAGWALAFPLGLGGIGIWLGLALGLALAAITMTARFWRRALAPAGAGVSAP